MFQIYLLIIQDPIKKMYFVDYLRILSIIYSKVKHKLKKIDQ
jgi:hypothetical protein